jgi:hypothetical protein
MNIHYVETDGLFQKTSSKLSYFRSVSEYDVSILFNSGVSAATDARVLKISVALATMSPVWEFILPECGSCHYEICTNMLTMTTSSECAAVIRLLDC